MRIIGRLARRCTLLEVIAVPWAGTKHADSYSVPGPVQPPRLRLCSQSAIWATDQCPEFATISCLQERAARSLRHLGVFEPRQSANCLFVSTLEHNPVIPTTELADWDRDEACANTEKAANA